MIRALLALLCIALFALPPFAQDAYDYPPEIEAQARDIGRKLRCVVCQNQSIEDSDAPLAADMRVMVRERLASGQTEAQIMDYMQHSYGDFVLRNPPIQNNTRLLWYGPPALLIMLLLWFLLRRKSAAS
ncbi:cytochrome c-type biogenesis protein [Robiginitomaculum antarcticum]|uniref:cytochrome c-type biogenesis protein n=1 Tax=Robiginitomaculum antarcticum TaxID=437507 RepID=UPI00035E2A5C|nr:cytochrome c-type biogenesis protein [Robiginitomaculum antarcticum]